MATSAKWTVIFEDKCIIKNYDEGADQGIGYNVSDDAFWNKPEFSNIWAIQCETANINDEVEHRDGTAHCSLATEGISFQQFIDHWDAANLAFLQKEWDDDVIEVWTGEGTDAVLESTESEADQIARKGPRPTSYSSS
tara:strand:+ start:477 stop:890 length:414 start_codon:yes stop_codon:yes gene_type:complete